MVIDQVKLKEDLERFKLQTESAARQGNFFTIGDMAYTCSMREIGSVNTWNITQYPTLFLNYINLNGKKIYIMNLANAGELLTKLLVSMDFEVVYKYVGSDGEVTTFMLNLRK
jgi:hypothetical protein